MEEFENLSAFLDHVALVMDNDADDSASKVTILTIHAAKGLEFDTVFLAGWEEGVFPSQRSLDEEIARATWRERRCMYVSMSWVTESIKTNHNKRNYLNNQYH